MRLELNPGSVGLHFTLYLEQAPGSDPCPELEELLRELDAFPA